MTKVRVKVYEDQSRMDEEDKWVYDVHYAMWEDRAPVLSGGYYRTQEEALKEGKEDAENNGMEVVG